MRRLRRGAAGSPPARRPVEFDAHRHARGPAMHRNLPFAFTLSLVTACASAPAGQQAPPVTQSASATTPAAQRSAFHGYRVVTVAEGLVNPWSMAWLPNGDMLVTERPGRLRIVRNGRLLPDAVPGLPAIRVGGQGGLLDVVPHPQFASNRM